MVNINRRKFAKQSVQSALIFGVDHSVWCSYLRADSKQSGFKTDVAIIGGSLGGCSAAFAALRNGHQVVLTEETEWIGGQLTSQGVPPDEHRWIESFGSNASYRELRRRIRNYYRTNYPLKHAQRQKWQLNPGNGSVSRLCHEPRVALAVLLDWLAPYISSGQLIILNHCRPVGAEVNGGRIQSVEVFSEKSGEKSVVEAPVFIDATELGDLLPLAKVEYVVGTESKAQTGEMHASESARPDNHQAFTMCFAMDHMDGENHVIAQPERYGFWRKFMPDLSPAWPGRLLDWTYTHPRSSESRLLGFNPGSGGYKGIINLWNYRRILAQSNFETGSFKSDISLVNWPQNDYFLGSIIDVKREEFLKHVWEAKQLSLSLLHWMQTEAPRHDDGQGYPGLRLRPDVMGTEDGLAMYPYVRESRRIQAEYTVTEQDCGLEQRIASTGTGRADVRAESYSDAIGIGSYPIDLHPSTGGDNYIDFETLPFQIPLGALIPKRIENLIPACKNIGTTHVTNGCYRLHPVEWGIGETAGLLAHEALKSGQPIRSIRNQKKHLNNFQATIKKQGVESEWPDMAF